MAIGTTAAILGGLGALGGVFGGKKQKTDSISNQSGTFSNTGTTSPVTNPAFTPLQAALIKNAMGRLDQPLPAGYEAGGIRSINDAYKGVDMNLQNRLAAQGLTGSPIAGAANTSEELSRGSDIARFSSQIPLVQQQLQNQNFAQALGLFGAQPLGQTSTSSGTQAGTAIGNVTGSMGGGVGGAFGGAGSMLGLLAALGQLGGSKIPTAPVPSFGPLGLGDILGSLGR